MLTQEQNGGIAPAPSVDVLRAGLEESEETSLEPLSRRHLESAWVSWLGNKLIRQNLAVAWVPRC